MPTPLDPLLLQTALGQDEFVNEKYAARIAAISHEWSAALPSHAPGYKRN